MSRRMQETSLMAYREVLPKLGERQASVYRLLEKASVNGFNMTNMEISKALGWSINRVTPRVFELRQEGFVCLATRRCCGVTGRMAMAWKVTKTK